MKTFALHSRDYIDIPDQKRIYNEHLFTEVAPTYDRITRLLSFGQDHGWKKLLIKSIPGQPAACLDLACGTGDLTLMVHERFPEANVTGVDLTPAMLEIARTRTTSPKIKFLTGDMGRLEFEDGSMDLITGGYALRNAPDVPQAVSEMARVLKSGGCLALLDFSKSPHRFRHALDFAALKTWGGFWGWALHGHADVYGYIAESLKRFPDRRNLHRLLTGHNLFPLVEVPRFGGMLQILLCRKIG